MVVWQPHIARYGQTDVSEMLEQFVGFDSSSARKEMRFGTSRKGEQNLLTTRGLEGSETQPNPTTNGASPPTRSPFSTRISRRPCFCFFTGKHWRAGEKSSALSLFPFSYQSSNFLLTVGLPSVFDLNETRSSDCGYRGDFDTIPCSCVHILHGYDLGNGWNGA